MEIEPNFKPDTLTVVSIAEQNAKSGKNTLRKNRRMLEYMAFWEQMLKNGLCLYSKRLKCKGFWR